MGAHSSVLNVATTFKESDFPTVRGQGVYLSPQHTDIAVRPLNLHLILTPVGSRAVPLLKSKAEQLPDCVLGGKLLDVKDVQTREGVKKEFSGLVLQGTYCLDDLLAQGKLRLPNLDIYTTILEALILAGRQMEFKLESPVLTGLESVYILSDGKIALSNPYLDPNYLQMQLEKIIPFIQGNSTGFTDARSFFQREAEKNPSGFEGQAWNLFNFRLRLAVQMVFVISMKLAIGNRDKVVLNSDGTLEIASIQNQLRIFESYYPPEQTQLLRKILLNPLNTNEFPTFLSFQQPNSINRTIQLNSQDFDWVKKTYTLSQTSIPVLNQSVSKPPIIVLEKNLQQSTVRSYNALPLNAATPMLDKFKKHPIEYQYPAGKRDKTTTHPQEKQTLANLERNLPVRPVEIKELTQGGQTKLVVSQPDVHNRSSLPRRILDPFVDSAFHNDYKSASNWRQSPKEPRAAPAFFDEGIHQGSRAANGLPPGFLEATAALPPGFLSATHASQGFYEPPHRGGSIPSVRQEALHLGAGNLNSGLTTFAQVRGIVPEFQHTSFGGLPNTEDPRRSRERNLIEQKVSRINEKSRSPSVTQLQNNTLSNIEFLKSIQRRRRGSDLVTDADRFLGSEKNFHSMNKIRAHPMRTGF